MESAQMELFDSRATVVHREPMWSPLSPPSGASLHSKRKNMPAGSCSLWLIYAFTVFIYCFFFKGMKHPYRPSELDSRSFSSGLDMQMDDETNSDSQAEGAVQDQRSLGDSLPSALHKPKREGKQRRYMLCEVCNIQLNSTAQAQIHYNGKSHQKRLKQISNGKVSSNTGRCCGMHFTVPTTGQHITESHTGTRTHTLHCPLLPKHCCV